MAELMDRERAVEQAISQIERQFGRGSIMKMSEERVIDLPAISTGSLALDLALGVGGVPKGRVVEIYGPEASGKTTLALHVTAEAQDQGGMVAFIDAEHALDVGYARKLGVDVDSLLVSQPDTGEQALDIAEILVRSGAIDALIIDSVAAHYFTHGRFGNFALVDGKLGVRAEDHEKTKHQYPHHELVKFEADQALYETLIIHQRMQQRLESPIGCCQAETHQDHLIRPVLAFGCHFRSTLSWEFFAF